MVFAGVGQDEAACEEVEAGVACKAEDDGASVSTGVGGTSVGGYSSSDASGISVAEWRVRAEAVMGSGMDRDAQLDQLGELVSSLHSMPRADPAECAYANIIQPEDLTPFQNLLRQSCDDHDGVFDMRGAVGREWGTEVLKTRNLRRATSKSAVTTKSSGCSGRSGLPTNGRCVKRLSSRRRSSLRRTCRLGATRRSATLRDSRASTHRASERRRTTSRSAWSGSCKAIVYFIICDY